ncbi:phage tail tape measure protein [Staphylococcus pseudintermedius]|uniref:phage tail tape measure protein n=1 Tax=Staphylococcus pseudintermedius TaxID=283734 RepID=UPI0011231DD9|nr:phage tail tape measure protein [Staphylococcus pseudintermedius]TPD24925.1 phage tail tape measure protein [Staphylococcus pseudintermedius]
MANGFNIGILSTLDVDSSSSRQQINEKIKEIEKNINKVSIDIEAKQTKGASSDLRRSANSVIDNLNKSSQLRKVKVDLDVNLTQSKQNIKKAISTLSDNLSKNKIKVNIDANVDTNAVQRAGKSISTNAQKGLGTVSSTTSKGQTQEIEKINNSMLHLQKTYSDVSKLSNELSSVRDNSLRTEIKSIKDANGALQSYQVNLQRINELGKTLGKESYNYKANSDGSLSLEKVADLNSQEKARKLTHDSMVKSMEQEVSALDRMVEKQKLSTSQAENIKNVYNQLSRLAKDNKVINPEQFTKAKSEADRLLKNYTLQNEQLKEQEKIQSAISKELERINKLETQGKISKGQAAKVTDKYNNFDKKIDTGGVNNLSSEFNKVKQSADGLLLNYSQQNKLLNQQVSLLAQIDRAERRLASTIDKRATSQLKGQLQNLNSNGSGTFGKEAAYQMSQIQGQVRTITAEAERATRSQLGFVESFRQAMIKFPVWMGATTLFFGAIRSGQNFLSIISDIDSKMVTLSKVMNDNADLESVFLRANDAALQYGQTISNVLDVYAEFARQGYGEADTTVFGNAALIASNVGEIDAKQASEYLTSMSAQWETSATDAMRQVDSLNQISNEYATTVEKLAQGQAKAGSTAKSMGLTFDETNAIVGALTAKTKQSGDEIGNFLKAVLPKLYVGTGKNTITDLGINMKDSNGQLKSAITLLEEVSQKIKNVDKDQQAAVIRGLGGTYHYQRMQVLLDDLSKADSLYKQIKNTSENSAGSAIAENQKYLESVEAKVNRAKVSIEQFAVAIGDAFVKSGMLDGLRLFTNLMTSLTRHVQELGSTSVLIGTLAGTMSLFSKNVRGGFEDARLSIANFIAEANDLESVTQKMKKADGTVVERMVLEGSKGRIKDNQVGAASQLVMDESLEKYDMAASKAKAASTSTLAFADSQKTLTTQALLTSSALNTSNIKTTATATVSKVATVAVNGFKAAMRGLASATLVGVAIAGISFVLEKIISKFDSASNAAENYKMQQDTLKQTIESMGGTGEIDKLIDKYTELENKMRSGKSFDDTEAAQYKETVSQIKNIFPDLVSSEGQYGATLSANSSVLKQRVELMKQQLEIEKQRAQNKQQQEAIETAKSSREEADKIQSGGLLKPNLENELRIKTLSVGYDKGSKEIDNKVLKVKSLNDALEIQKLILEKIALAESNGDTKEAARWSQKNQYLQNYINKKNEVATLEQAQTNAEAQKFDIQVNRMLSKNQELGDSSKSVFITLNQTVQGLVKNGEQAEKVFTQFTASLAQDAGFAQKMQTYENALNNFKNAKNEAERADKLPALEAAYTQVAKAILEVAKSSGLSKSQQNELKQAIEGNIEAETEHAVTISNTGKVTIDASKNIKQNTKAVDENSLSKEDNAEATEKMKKANEEMANAMRDAASTQELLGKAQGELGSNGELSWDTQTDLVKQYGVEVLDLMNDHEALSDFLATKREEEIAGHLEMLNAKEANDADYYKKTFAKGSELTEYLSEQYGIDASQYGTMNELKAGITDIYNNGTAKQQQKLVDGIAEYYGIDLSNFGTLAEKKDALETELAKQLGNKWTTYINHIADTTNAIFEKLDGSLLSKAPAYKIAKSFTQGSLAAAKQFTLNAGKLILDTDAKFNKASNQKFNSNIADQLKGIGDNAKNAASGLDGVGRSGNGASKGLGKAGKAMDKASKEADKLEKEAASAGVSVEKLYKTFTVTTYVADELQMALDKVNFQLEKQKLNTQKYAVWSQKYRDSLKAENKLIDEKTKKLNEQIKSMQEQIKAGQVIEYGLVNSDYNAPYLKFTANGLDGGKTASIGAVGSTTQEKVWNYLRGKGLSEHAVAGIMGNIERESRFLPNAKEPNGTGIGLVQWSFGRADNLRNFAKRRGKSWADLNTQLDFLWQELQTTERGALNALKASGSVIGAADAFQRKFERAGVVAQGQRNSAANRYYKQFKGSNGGSAVKVSNAGQSIVAGWKKTAPFGHYYGTNTPHYGVDYASSVGSPIRAARGGVVLSSGWSNYGGGNQIVIYNPKLNKTFTYMHMLSDLRVKKGQQVVAGQLIGRMGNTGNSSGPHLHFQVNEGKGFTAAGTSFTGWNRAINPEPYLRIAGDNGKFDFRNMSNLDIPTGELSQAMVDSYNQAQEQMLAEIEAGINEHNESEKMKQKVDELRKKLMDTQLELVRNMQAKNENLFNIHKSNIASFDHSRELQAAKSAKYEYELNKIEFEKGRNSKDWRKKNEQLQTSKELEKGWEQDKIKYIDKVIKQNKGGILGKQTAFRDELEKVKREAQQNVRDIASGIMRARGEIIASLIDQIIEDYTKDTEKIQRSIDSIGKKKGHLDPANVDQAKTLVDLTTQQHKEATKLAEKTKFYITQLEAQAKKVKKNAELKKRLTNQIKEMKTAFDDATLSAHEFLKEAADLAIERQLTINARRLKEFQTELRKAEYKNAFVNSEFQIDLFRDGQEKMLNGYAKEQQALEKNKKELEEQLKLYKKLPAQSEKIKDSIEEITNALQENNKSLHNLRFELANSIINSMKTVYQKQLEVATKAYDDEYKEYEKLINKKLKLIDEEAQEETFQKDVKEKTENLNKIRDEIAQRLGDDSLANQKKLKDLREQLRQGEEEYETYLRNKNREDRKQALQDELQDKNDQLTQQKEDLNKAFTDLLEDTRRFNSIQEELMAGQIDKYKAMVEDLTKFVSDNMKDIGNSVGQNIIDGIDETFKNLLEVAQLLQKQDKGNNPVPNSSLKPKPLSEATAAAIKQINAVAPSAILNGLQIKDIVKPKDIGKSTNVTTNNNTQAKSLVNIENFNGSKKEVDDLVGTLENALRKKGTI